MPKIRIEFNVPDFSEEESYDTEDTFTSRVLRDLARAAMDRGTGSDSFRIIFDDNGNHIGNAEMLPNDG